MTYLYNHVVEVGAGDSYSSEGLKMAGQSRQITLYEPNVILHADLLERSRTYGNVDVRPAAIQLYSGSGGLYHFGYASFHVGAESFLGLSVEEEGIEYWRPLLKLVNVRTMKEVDEGDIDYLILTSNGSELAALRQMVSRPKTIRTKVYAHNARHWGYYQQTFAWMQANRYVGLTLDRNEHSTYLHIEWTRQP